jgi:hypothetical protein
MPRGWLSSAATPLPEAAVAVGEAASGRPAVDGAVALAVAAVMVPVRLAAAGGIVSPPA